MKYDTLYMIGAVFLSFGLGVTQKEVTPSAAHWIIGLGILLSVGAIVASVAHVVRKHIAKGKR